MESPHDMDITEKKQITKEKMNGFIVAKTSKNYKLNNINFTRQEI